MKWNDLGIIVLILFGCLRLEAAGYDVVVYGASSGGVTAAVQTARMGKRVLLISQDGHVGGLTASGLGATDINQREAIGGLSREFYQRVYDYYSRSEVWTNPEGWEYYSRQFLEGKKR